MYLYVEYKEDIRRQRRVAEAQLLLSDERGSCSLFVCSLFCCLVTQTNKTKTQKQTTRTIQQQQQQINNNNHSWSFLAMRTRRVSCRRPSKNAVNASCLDTYL